MGKNSKNIFSLWFFWQFQETPAFLFEVWKNYLIFALNYFSLPLLLKTFFSPWKRYNWNYPRFFDVGEFFSVLISNFFSRLLGALMRLFLIIAGIFFQVFIILAGLAVIILWIIMPVLALALLILIFNV